MEEFDDAAIFRTFLAESDEGLAVLEQALIALETTPANDDLLQAMFRAAHTLKGNAANLDLPAVAEIAHAVEDILDRLRNQTLCIDAALVTLLLSAVDALRALVPASVDGQVEMTPRQQAVLDRLRAVTQGAPASALAPMPAATEDGERSGGVLDVRSHTLRVGIDTLDRLLNLTGEIAVSRGRLQLALEGALGHGAHAALEVHREADRLFTDLQELVTKARMIPIGPAFQAFHRAVRDVAAAHGKKARLTTVGEDVEVDNKIVEHMRDPLTHMVRNAIDHGLEPPDARAAAGKDPCGTITLRAFHEAGSLLIEVADDGGGLRRERILETAQRQGLLAETDPDKLSSRDVARLIFAPGFSTAEAVTDLSGRGVGLDVVRRNVELLRGTIDVESRAGLGTTIRIRLPLTLSIIPGFAVAVGHETYVVPLEYVVECLELPAATTGSGDHDSGLLNLRGSPLPYLRLRRLFDETNGRADREHVIVVQHQGHRAGLAVDALLGESQTVIKPLGRLFEGLPGVSGGAILGNGRVALILDVPGLLRDALAAQADRREPASAGLGSAT